ncbi:MAG: mismatch repair protein MutS, partial [Patescibacteria group bacterium]|nr:mismatch repair protein MutS [Patescibacteria group bacterium]
MQQYTEVKKEYPDYLLFYRMGDFYELFLEDALTGSKVLDITLTSRNKGGTDDIPMCGVPFHALDNYLARVVNAGLKAAICEQITKPSKGVTLVERKVVRLVTPGTVIDESLLDKQLNNYLATFQLNEREEYTLAYGDLSTLNFSIIQNHGKQNLINDLRKINPKEIVLSETQYNSEELGYLSEIDGINISRYSDTVSKTQYQMESLIQSLNVKTLEAFGIHESDSLAISSLHRLIEYIKFTQKTTKISYGNIRKVNTTDFMRLDIETLTNLEIFRSNKLQPNNKELNLMSVLDKTKTSMGARKLRYWVMNPLIDTSLIKIRQNAVEDFINNHLLREDSQQLLNSIQDIERIFSRITSGLGNARDLKSLESSLENATTFLEKLNASTDEIKQLLQNKSNDEIDLSKLILTTREIAANINNKIVENPPFSTREGGMIKSNIIDELDEIINSISESKIWIEQLEGTERIATKIPNLKVGFNSVFGYYIEITKSYIHLAPAHYHRKQTLVNAERYITDELKIKESIVLTAQDKINEIEFEAFTKLCQELKLNAENIHSLADIISEADCIISFADLAIKNNYSRPTLFEK